LATPDELPPALQGLKLMLPAETDPSWREWAIAVGLQLNLFNGQIDDLEKKVSSLELANHALALQVAELKGSKDADDHTDVIVTTNVTNTATATTGDDPLDLLEKGIKLVKDNWPFIIAAASAAYVILDKFLF